MTEHYGDLSHCNGYVTAVMEREVEATPAEVWPMLSEEVERVKWLAPGSIDLYSGGRARLDFKDSYVLVDSEVTACEAPRVLEFSWSGANEPQRPVRFEILPAEAGCSLIRLSVGIPDNEVVARSVAGWEAHLTMLQAALAGVSIKFPLDRFKACREAFDEQLASLVMQQMEVVRL